MLWLKPPSSTPMNKPPGERPQSVPDRVSLQLPKTSGAASGKYPRCASCGLFITIGIGHGPPLLLARPCTQDHQVTNAVGQPTLEAIEMIIAFGEHEG